MDEYAGVCESPVKAYFYNFFIGLADYFDLNMEYVVRRWS